MSLYHSSVNNVGSSPHARGAPTPPTCLSCRTGSSPHARGAPLDVVNRSVMAGIIPACAGSTVDFRAIFNVFRDHPRMRGEHHSCASMATASMGSSPHARGAHKTIKSACRRVGIIPACAGSTNFANPRRHRHWDHPRMRGEHRRNRSTAEMSKGSSPHARGAQAIREEKTAKAGIIPACAGSTRRGRLSGSSAGDHPRMRGEHSKSHVASSPTLGSSPHARGAPLAHRLVKDVIGIIPACAGSTSRVTSRATRHWDHPRMRGEHGRPRTARSARRGSSPHARGAQQHAVVVNRALGIIPACAGSTHGALVQYSADGDHPRMRGEHF